MRGIPWAILEGAEIRIDIEELVELADVVMVHTDPTAGEIEIFMFVPSGNVASNFILCLLYHVDLYYRMDAPGLASCTVSRRPAV